MGLKLDVSKWDFCDSFLQEYEKCDSSEQWWNECQRGDWMLTIAKKLRVDEKLLFRAKALCAKTVEHLMRDERSKKAVQAALDFADGKISRDELSDAAAAADAADTADTDAARAKNRKQTADICREILTEAVREAALLMMGENHE
jgi:hypothetical protein